MTKVVHIITRLDFGGAQANTLHTARTLDRSRFEALVICGRHGDLDGRAGDANIVRSSRLVREISPLNDLLAFFELRSKLRELRPQVVHTHSSKAGILGRLAARAAGVPVIIHTFHGFGFHPRQGSLKRNFYIALERLCARVCDALVFVSKANMDTARELGIGDPAKYVLIRSGIALAAYPARTDRAAKRAELGLDLSHTVVISIGNAKPQKNPGHFLEAAARLSKGRPSARFVFVGGGEQLEPLRAAARSRGLEGVCLFTGWREDTAELLAASDAFALTSYWEGLPRALVEALKTGLPAVCYRTDGVADVLRDGENGFCAEQGDLDAFCSSLAKVLDDAPLRARLAAGAAATDLAEFDIDHMVRRQEELYASLLRGKGIL